MKALRTIILGSSSPHRAQVLRATGLPFTTASADINEKSFRHENPMELTLMLAYAKSEALVRRIREVPDYVLITSDQVVSYHGNIREKPSNVDEARLWLEQYGELENDEIQIVTSVVVCDVRGGMVLDQEFVVDTVRLGIRHLGPAVAEALLLKGKVLGVAGAVTIEDPLFWAHVTGISNAFGDEIDAKTSAQGLPLVQTLKMLQSLEAVAA